MEVMGSKRRTPKQEKWESIINEHYSTGISLPVLARKYGVHVMSLYTWKRQMSSKKEETESLLNLEYVRKLIEENDRLKGENKNLKAKVGELAISCDILKDGLEIVQKKAALKALQSQKKSRRSKNTK